MPIADVLIRISRAVYPGKQRGGYCQRWVGMSFHGSSCERPRTEHAFSKASIARCGACRGTRPGATSSSMRSNLYAANRSPEPGSCQNARLARHLSLSTARTKARHGRSRSSHCGSHPALCPPDFTDNSIHRACNNARRGHRLYCLRAPTHNRPCRHRQVHQGNGGR